MMIYEPNKHRYAKPIEYDINGDCWVCTSHKQSGYYGIKVRRGGNNVMLHRYIYELTRLEPIADGYVLKQQCDNPKCINPDHMRMIRKSLAQQ